MSLLSSSFSNNFSSLQEMPKTTRPFRFTNPKISMSLTDNTITKVAEPKTLKKAGFGFKSLTGTIFLNVKRAEGRLMDTVRLREPAITGDIEVNQIENVAIRAELRNGFVGWGEAAVVPPATADLEETVGKVAAACEFLRRSQDMTLDLVLDEIGKILPGHQFGSVRSGVEMALIDAAANSINVPLWRLFGGSSNSLSTSLSIPVRSAEETFRLVSMYSSRGFKSFKLNLGKDLESEIEAFRAVRLANRNCTVILDANEAFSSREALQVVEKLQVSAETGGGGIVLEQPVKREDWEGLKHVHAVARDSYGVVVAVDESCLNLSDVHKVIRERLADVINVKLSKFGVLGAMEVIEAAKIGGLDVMIDGLFETRLATGFSAQFAAGLGCFKYVVLDTPLLQMEDPIIGGYQVAGSVYKFTNSRGQGGFLKWHLAP